MPIVDSKRSLFVLQDATGALAISLDIGEANIRPGQRIFLEAECAVPSSAAFSGFSAKPLGSDWLPTFSALTNWGALLFGPDAWLSDPAEDGRTTYSGSPASGRESCG